MIWKDIPNFEGYQVSNTGLVRTHNKVTRTEFHGVRHWKDRVLKPKHSYKSRRNQERVDLWKDGKPYGFIVARLVAFTFLNADINDGNLTVNHIDGNWKNNNLYNLELVSLSENIRHGFEHGLYSTCEPVVLTNKNTGVVEVFRSKSEASEHMHKHRGYISSMTKRGKSDNNDYTWRLQNEKIEV